jgi:nicotinamide-nucleotide amidase
MKTIIINIGDEILIGQIVNTNAAWMATELNVYGIDVVKMVTVSDEKKSITAAVEAAMNESELVLITGGLGPTKDDITKKTLCDLFADEMHFHQESFDNIVRLLEQFGRVPDDRYRIQAMMPKNAQILINKVGTASGMWFEKEGKIVVSMPGVPKEMMYLVSKKVLPLLQARQIIQEIVHSTYICYGKGETDLSEILEDFENSLPTNIKLAYLPNTANGYIRLRITGKGNDRASLEKAINSKAEEMCQVLGTLIFGKDDDSLESVLSKLLHENKLTLSIAESCTGGKISHKITSVPGCSRYFMGSVVAYSNELKTDLLAVNPAIIENFGAVSEETVIAMALGAKSRFKTDFVIASSGIAGPEGGTDSKPVGTIWIAIAHPGGVFAKKLKLGNNRERNIEMTSNIAINTLRLLLLNQLNEDLKPTY